MLKSLILNNYLGLLGNDSVSPTDELEEMAGVREVWASLFRLLPPAIRIQISGKKKWMNGRMDEWMDGWTLM